MNVNYDCRNFTAETGNRKCAVIGRITECPCRCEEYVDFKGRQPYKTDLEKQLRGEA